MAMGFRSTDNSGSLAVTVASMLVFVGLLMARAVAVSIGEPAALPRRMVTWAIVALTPLALAVAAVQVITIVDLAS